MARQIFTLPAEKEGDMQAYVAFSNDGARRPGILVFQEAFGVDHHIRKVADKFADAGYIAIAPELFHRTTSPGTTIPYTDFESVRPHISPLTTEGLTNDIKACHGWLLQHPGVRHNKIGAVGFALGEEWPSWPMQSYPLPPRCRTTAVRSSC